MKTLIFASLLALSSLTGFAQDTDLELTGERWLAQFTTYICADGNTAATQAPAELDRFNVTFGRLTTDYSLDNVLVKATFQENGVECNYSALLFADNAAFTAALVDSKAFSSDDRVSCLEGKAAIDSALEFNPYKYLHGRAAIFINSVNAQAACGNGSDSIGIHFQVRGRISQ